MRWRHELSLAFVVACAYVLAAVVLTHLSFLEHSSAWKAFVWLGLFPLFNLVVGFRSARIWFSVFPLFGMVVILGIDLLVVFTGWRSIVLTLAFLSFGSMCVAVGAALALRRRGDRERSRRALAVVLPACIAVILGAVLLELSLARNPDCSEFELTHVVGPEKDRMRYDGRTMGLYVVDNAVRCGTLVGLSKRQIRAYFGDGEPGSERGYRTYSIGSTDILFGTEYHYLAVRFDRRSGRAIEAKSEDVTD